MTLIEAMLGFVGLGILLLMVYTVFFGGMQSWTTMTPQIDARKVAREILYGKPGDIWGGLIEEIKGNRTIRLRNPLDIDPSGHFQINFEGEYPNSDNPDSRTMYFISYKWEGSYAGDPLSKNLLTFVGSLTKTIWESRQIGTQTLWDPPQGIKTCLTNNVRLNINMYGASTEYPLFRYYNGLGIEIYNNPVTPNDEVADAIAAGNIRQIGISMTFDIDNDRDGKFGEDPVGDGNQDEDNKIDEDRPNDFSIKAKAVRNL